MTSVAVLDVRGLTVEYAGRDPVRAATDVTFSVEPGETIAIVGESGSGKSTVALALLGLLGDSAAVSGRVRLAGRDLMGLSSDAWRAVRGAEIAMVFQDPAGSLNPSMRVGAQVAEAVAVHESLTRPALRARTVELLAQVGIPEPERRARAYAHELSGGLQQRVVLAMALANRPKVLVADEPTTALDATTQAQILTLLRERRDDAGLAIVLVTHDFGVVAAIADRVAVMYASRIVEDGPVDDVLRAPRHPYTVGLLAAVPRVDRKATLEQLGGAPPDPRALPVGCAFHPRCWLADDACIFHQPRLRSVGVAHEAACVHVDQVPIPVRWP